jgi:hypothetical protein
MSTETKQMDAVVLQARATSKSVTGSSLSCSRV